MTSFNAYLVTETDAGIEGRIQPLSDEQLPAGDVTVDVAWSSLNYKDALAAGGHPGVAGQLPHVPGIDAAGVVAHSNDGQVPVGSSVLITGHELGAGQWGGWSQRVRVPAEWVIPLPESMTARDAMALGTAGFTAAQCVLRLQQFGLTPESGPILVSGATGGVGCLAVALLKHCGFEVVASTGKPAAAWLERLGASRVVSREDVLNPSKRPLSRALWAGAVDTVGGETLASILRATQLHGCVTACGLVGGDQLPTSVYPFILRGVALSGVTSQNCPRPQRQNIWERFGSDWKFDLGEDVVRDVPLSKIDNEIAAIREGKVKGRVIVDVNS